MMTISFETSGNFKKTDSWLRKLLNLDMSSTLDRFGKMGVDALSKATPTRSGLAANSWYYKIEKTKNSARLIWCNDNIENGFPVVIMIQYGHGTGTGGYVEGEDFINPAIKPIFDKIKESLIKEVKSA